jgi:hypothetical protein
MWDGAGSEVEQKIELGANQSVVRVSPVRRVRNVLLGEVVCGGVWSSVIVLGKEPLSGFPDCGFHSRQATCA